jgi:hypothetical protein
MLLCIIGSICVVFVLKMRNANAFWHKNIFFKRQKMSTKLRSTHFPACWWLSGAVEVDACVGGSLCRGLLRQRRVEREANPVPPWLPYNPADRSALCGKLSKNHSNYCKIGCRNGSSKWFGCWNGLVVEMVRSEWSTGCHATTERRISQFSVSAHLLRSEALRERCHRRNFGVEKSFTWCFQWSQTWNY